MNTIHVFLARTSALLFVLLFCSTAFAGGDKSDVCHVPPDDTDNVHMISVSDNAYEKHLVHGDSPVNSEGTCEDTTDPVATCPCFGSEGTEELPGLDELTGVASCGEEFPGAFELMTTDGGYACTGDCLDVVDPLDCIYESEGMLLGQGEFTDVEENTACLALMAVRCMNLSTSE
jgi:hypothetical protein